MKKWTIFFLLAFVVTLAILTGCEESQNSATSSASAAPVSSSSQITVSSQPPTQVAVGQLYSYQIQASSSSSASLSYQLVTAPGGMTISNSGLINWTPSASQTGAIAVWVEIGDGTAQKTMNWTIQVSPSSSSSPTTPSVQSSGGSGGGGQGQISFRQLTVNSLTGSYYIYVPSTYSDSQPTSLVYTQHGAGGNGQQMVQLWDSVAQNNNFIVVGLNSQGQGWNFNSDIQVFEALAKEIEKDYNINLSRIYLHGFSAGAHWALVYGLYKSDEFAAMSLAGGGYMGYAQQYNIWPNNVARKIPVDIHIGLSDPNLSMAQDTKSKLTAAGHTVYYHEFNGGHTIYPSHIQEVWNNFKANSLP